MLTLQLVVGVKVRLVMPCTKEQPAEFTIHRGKADVADHSRLFRMFTGMFTVDSRASMVWIAMSAI